MDFVWNQSQAEDVRRECERVMRRQVDNMRETAESHRRIEQRELANARMEDHIAATATKTVWFSDNYNSWTEEVPDWVERARAARFAESHRQYASGLHAHAAQLDTAIAQLEADIRATNAKFDAMHAEAQHLDRTYASQIDSIGRDMYALTAWANEVRDGILPMFGLSVVSLRQVREQEAVQKLLVKLEADYRAGKIDRATYLEIQDAVAGDSKADRFRNFFDATLSPTLEEGALLWIQRNAPHIVANTPVHVSAAIPVLGVAIDAGVQTIVNGVDPVEAIADASARGTVVVVSAYVGEIIGIAFAKKTGLINVDLGARVGRFVGTVTGAYFVEPIVQSAEGVLEGISSAFVCDWRTGLPQGWPIDEAFAR